MRQSACFSLTFWLAITIWTVKVKGLVASCHSFYLFYINRADIQFFKYILLVEYHSCYPRSFRSVEGLLWGAEPRFELGPAVQQAGVLLSEPRCTLTELYLGTHLLWSKINKIKLNQNTDHISAFTWSIIPSCLHTTYVNPMIKRRVNTDLPPLKSGEHKISNIEWATNPNTRINNLHAIFYAQCENDSMDRNHDYNCDEMISWFFISMNIE
jgi:hypothetical protein